MTMRRPLQHLSLNIPGAIHAAGSSSRSPQDAGHRTNDKAVLRALNQPKSLKEPEADTFPILPELLPEIFLYVVIGSAGQVMMDQEKSHLLSDAEGCGHVHFSGESSLRALLKLGQVCRVWREIVRTTPLLWSHIHFSKVDSKDEDAARHQESMNYMLTRSKSLPLTMTITLGAHHFVYDDYYGQEHVTPFMEILFVIVTQQWRIKHLSVDVHCCSSVRALTQSLADMPELETLIFRSPVDDRTDDAIIEIGLDRSPLIRHLHLDGDFVLKPITQILPNLKIVRMLYRETFRKSFPSVADCISLLQFAPALEVLQVDICSDEIPEEKVEVCSSSLRVFSLRVNDESDEAARFLLDSLKLPNLEALDIDIGRSIVSDDGPHNHVYDFIQRCKAPLRSFSFCSEETEESEVMRFLQFMPQLRELRLTDVGLTEVGINEMTLRGNSTDNLCPKLESLSFYDGALGPDPLESSDRLTAMVFSRRYGVSGALKKFKLSGCGWRGFVRLPLVQFCIEDGLEVVCK